VPPSRRLQAGAVLFMLLMTLSICLAPAPAWGWRLVAAAAAVALGWHPVRAILFQRGAAAVHRFEWAADGAWHVLDSGGGRMAVRLASQTAAIGPWILLVWVTAPTPGKGRGLFVRRRYALIDAARVSPTEFRALRGRLKLAPVRIEARHPDDNC
jgi:hypothetical protein